MPAFPASALDLILNLADRNAAELLTLSGSRVISSASSPSSSSRIIRADSRIARVRACRPNLSGERAFDDVDLSASTVRIALGKPGENPYCLATLSDPFPSAASVISAVQSATADLPATKRITLDPAPYAGAWLLTLDDLDPIELPWDVEAAQIQANTPALQYSIRKRSSNAWEISGVEPGQDVTVSVDISRLLVPLGLSGPIELNTDAAAAAFTAAGNPKWLPVVREITIDGEPVFQDEVPAVKLAREILNLTALVPAPIPPSDYASLSALIAAKQPASSRLTSLAAIAATDYGRSLLALADAGALRSSASLQPLNDQLSAIGDLATARYGRGLLTQSDEAALRAYADISFANLPDKPTTLDGYGITDDFYSLGDDRWVQSVNLNSLGDARWAALVHGHAQSEITNLVSDLALKSPLASPAFTGTPTVPTAANNISSTQAASTAFVHGVIGDVVGASPSTLDSLLELADAIGDDPNFAVTVANSVATKLSKASNLADLTDAAAARGNLALATIAASGAFADLVSHPTTIAGYGITDFNSLGDARWLQSANFNSLGDARWFQSANFNSLGDARWAQLLAANSFSALQTFNSIAARSIAVSQLGVAGAPTVTPIGGDEGATWSYKIVAKLSDGTPSAAGPAGATTHGDQTLDATNRISLSWTAVPGAASYDVYRTAHGVSPATNGKIANVLTNAYVDTGAAGDGSTPPATNATGGMSLTGPFTAGDATFSGTVSARGVRNLPSLVKDFGGTGDNSTNNDAAFTAALASAAPVIYVPEGTYVTTFDEAQLAGKRFTGPGFIKGTGDAFPHYRGPANFTRLDTAPASDALSLAAGKYDYVQGQKFVLEGACRHNLDTTYFNYSTTPHFVEANFRSGGSGYIATLTAPAVAGDTVINLDNVDGIVAGEDLGFGIGNSYNDRHTIFSVNPGAMQVTLATPLTLNHFISTLAVAANQGDTSVTLASVAGLTVGDTLSFYHSGSPEPRRVLTINPGTRVVTLGRIDDGTPAGFGAAHASGSTVVNQNNFTVLNAVRTMNQIWFGMMHNVAGGDAYIYGGQAHAWHPIPSGVHDFEENATAGFIGGALEHHADGTYTTAFEFQQNDHGYDVAAIGGIFNFNRSKGRFKDLYTGTLDTHAANGAVWLGCYLNSGGVQPLDAGYYLGGYFHVGMDFVAGTYENGCAIGLAAGQKIFFNNTASGTRSVLVGDTQGDVTAGYNPSSSAVEFKKGSSLGLSVTQDGIKVGSASGVIKGWLTGSGAYNFGTIAAGASNSFTISVPGAVENDIVVFAPVYSADPGFSWKWIAVTDGVLVVATNRTPGSLTSSLATYKVGILKT
jgi:Pectate lyase superfamily protein